MPRQWQPWTGHDPTIALLRIILSFTIYLSANVSVAILSYERVARGKTELLPEPLVVAVACLRYTANDMKGVKQTFGRIRRNSVHSAR